MASLGQTLVYIFVVFITVFHRLTNSQNREALLQSTTSFDTTDVSTAASSMVTSVDTNSTKSSSVTSVPNTSTAPMTTVNSSSATITSVAPSTTSINDTTPVPDVPSGPGWWLFIALITTIVIVVIAGVIFYYRQQTPYRRFLHNWRTQEDDTDNIVLQLEQSDVTNNPWPPEISFT